jgi:hypothetical protein
VTFCDASLSTSRYWWHRQTIAETFQRLRDAPDYPWVAIGDFVDEWNHRQGQWL